MSQSSYNAAGKPLKNEEQRKAGRERSDDQFDYVPSMPTEDFPISENGFAGEAVAGLEDVSGAELTDATVNPKSRFFKNGQVKKRPMIARSFTDEFIEKHGENAENDEQCFFRYQKGDDSAFFILYERYKSSVYAYCAKVLLSAGLAEELVEDTFQEVFLRVSQYRHTFVSGEFRAWIFTVTRNTCLSSKKRGLKNSLATGTPIDPDYVTDDEALSGQSNIRRSDDPLEILTQKETTNLLLAAIAELPETYREALLLSEYEGLTYEEIGTLTGTSLSTIRIRVFRAKKRLRKVLSPIMGKDYSAKETVADPEEDIV
ncbi:MAG: RNA polymerase sigma factor [Ignavibacteriota bacterium]